MTDEFDVLEIADRNCFLYKMFCVSLESGGTNVSRSL